MSDRRSSAHGCACANRSNADMARLIATAALGRARARAARIRSDTGHEQPDLLDWLACVDRNAHRRSALIEHRDAV